MLLLPQKFLRLAILALSWHRVVTCPPAHGVADVFHWILMKKNTGPDYIAIQVCAALSFPPHQHPLAPLLPLASALLSSHA